MVGNKCLQLSKANTVIFKFQSNIIRHINQLNDIAEKDLEGGDKRSMLLVQQCFVKVGERGGG